MKPTEGYVVADDTNLPRVDNLMFLQYMHDSDSYNAAEMRGAKTMFGSRESYVDAAIGYVEVKREVDLCFLKCRITPEHNVKSKLYTVTAIINEKDESIQEVKCLDCAAAEGGCKHAMCFITWLIRRANEPSTTSTTCYWKKPKLSGAVTTDKILMAQNIGKKRVMQENVTGLDLDKFVAECKERKISNSLFTNYKLETKTLLDYCIFNLLLQYVQQTATNHTFENFKVYVENILTDSVVAEIEEQTKNQVESKLWHALRQGRITASKIWEASRCQKDGALVQAILGGYKVPETAAILRGRKLEDEVRQKIEEQLNIQIIKSGFILINPFIGASPDGVTEDYVVEIKCPTSEKNLQNYCKSNNITDKYKAQIMLQMHAAKKTKGLFCLADPKFEETSLIHIYWIEYEPDYIMPIIKEAEEFYKKFLYDKLYDSAVTK